MDGALTTCSASSGFIRQGRSRRIRQALQVLGGAVVLGSEATSSASMENIQLAVDLARRLGMLVIEEPKVPVMALLAAHADQFSNIVTDDRKLLQFSSDRCTVYLGKDTRSLEPQTSETVRRSLGVPAGHVPTYLALTEKSKGNSVSAVTLAKPGGWWNCTVIYLVSTSTSRLSRHPR